MSISNFARFNPRKVFSGVLLSLLVFSSCEMGLGAAVDTEIPTVDIQYPPQNAIVRDTFKIAGICHDDLGVSSIKVTVTNTDSGISYGTLPATMDPSTKYQDVNKWSIDLNPKLDGRYEYPDGKYVISVVVRDKSGRNSGTASLSLDIDNTPPVFIVQNPGSIDSQSPEKYGSVLAINGQAVDDHSVNMNVKFFDENGDSISGTDFESQNITLSGTTEIGRYVKDDETSEKVIEYKKIYNDLKNIRFCSIKVFDNAKEYKNPDDNGIGSGNETSEIFLYDTVHSTYLSKTGFGLTLSDFKNILYGTLHSENVTSEELKSKTINTETSKLPFILDPNSPPTYSISSYSLSFKDDESLNTENCAQAFNSSKIATVINAGADGTGVKRSNVRVWLKEFAGTPNKTEIENFVSGIEAIAKETHKNVFEYYKELEKGQVPSTEAREYWDAEKIQIEGLGATRLVFDGPGKERTSSTQSLSIPVDLPDSGITGSKNYILVVTGFDEDGINIESVNGYYGFQGLATGASPKIEITSPETLSFVQTSALQSGVIFKGIAKPGSGESSLSRIEVEVTVTDEESHEKIATFTGSGDLGNQEKIKITEDGNSQNNPWNWECNVKNLTGYTDPAEGKTYLYSAKFTVYENGKDMSATRDIRLDLKKPEIEISALNNIYSVDTTVNPKKNFINGKINIKGSVQETNFSGIASANNKTEFGWNIYIDGILKDSSSKSGSEIQGQRVFEIEQDTRNLVADENEHLFDIEFFAIDMVGNRGEKRLSDFTGGQIVIDQKTDYPVIEVLNADVSITSKTAPNFRKNIFNPNDDLIFRVSDDDGIEKVEITLFDENNNQIGNKKTETEVNTGSLTYALPGTDGVYKVCIETFDINENTNKRKTKKEFLFAVSQGKASIDFSLKLNDSENTVFSSGGYVKPNENNSDSRKIVVNGSVISTVPVIKILRDGIEIANGTDIKSFTDEIIVLGENGEQKEVSYELLNSYGKTSVSSFIYIADKSVPVLENPINISNAPFTGGEWFTDSALTISGVITDNYSGVNEISYSVLDSEGTEKANGKIVCTNISGTKKYSFHGTISNLSAGENTLKLFIKDNVGNTGDVNNFIINVDTIAPEIEADKAEYITNGSQIQISGTTTETGSGIDRVDITIGNKEFSSSGNNAKVLIKNENLNGVRVWTLNADCSGLEGSKIVKATVWDKAGNKNSYNISSLLVDAVNPEIFIDSISPMDKASVIDKSIRISGRTKDNNSFDLSDKSAVVLSYVFGETWNEGNAKQINSFDPQDFYNWTFDYVFSEEITTPQKIILRAKCTDCAGNENLCDRALVIDPAANYPVVTLLNVADTGSYYALPTKMVSGTVSDDDGDIKGLWFTSDIDSLQGKKPSLNNNNGWVPIVVNNGVWSLTSELNEMLDGKYTLHFYCIDANNDGFSSKDSTIRFYYQGETVKKSNPVKISFDTSEPEISSVMLYKTEDAGLTASTLGDVVWSDNRNFSVGGNKKYLFAKMIVIANSINETGLTIGTENIALNSTNKFVASNKYIYKKAGGDEIIDTAEYNLKTDLQKNYYKDYVTYILGPFNLGDESKYQGSVNLRFVASSASLSGKKDVSINADNEGPKIKITYPVSSVYGKTAVSVVANDEAGTAVSKIEYLIPTTDQKEQGIKNIQSGWTEISTSETGEITFGSESENESDSLAYYTINHSHVTYASERTADRIWKIPVYFRMTDELGNRGYNDSLFISFDKESGIPSCEISYPDENTSAVSGVVTLSGKTICTNEVKEVHVQIDVNGDGEFTFADYLLLKAYWNLGEELVCEDESDSDSDWYILANGTTSWNLSVNTSILKDQNLAEVPSVISFRAKALNMDGLTKGYCDKRSADINWNKPAFKNLKLVQKKADGTNGTKLDYVSGMYIGSPESGFAWYLEGTCIDTNEKTVLSSFVVSTTEHTVASFDSSENVSSGLAEIFPDYKKEYPFSIKLNINNSTSSGLVAANLLASNNASDGIGQENISFNIDQTPPKMFGESSFQIFADSNRDTLRLKALNEKIDTVKNTVQNSDSVFTFGDSISEMESGLEYVAFYFERNGNNDVRIYDPMQDKKVTHLGTEVSGKYKNKDGLPVIKIQNGTRLANDKISAQSISDVCRDENTIRTGGLIKIGGVYRLITNVDKTSGTITFAPDADVECKDAEIVLAQIVNNRIKESPSISGKTFDYKNVMNDDGDGMIETLTENGTGYTWSASIFSNNIPDGPVEIHVVSIDKAGNTNHGYVQTVVQNARPRLAKVFLGTDLDGNGKFDFSADSEVVNSTTSLEGNTLNGKVHGEFVYYSCLNSDSREPQYIASISSDSFTIKDKLIVIPDFIGGNNSMKFTYNIADSEAALKNGEEDQLKAGQFKLYEMKENSESLISTVDQKSRTILDKYISEFGFAVIENTDSPFTAGGKTFNDLCNNADNKNKVRHLGITFWDETEETSQGTDSQWSLLKFTTVLNTVDKEPPYSKIKPFYWNGLHDNSIYGSEDESIQMVSGLAGHIELEDDLTDEIKASLGGDAKVSGKIVLSGAAFDDIKLDSIWVNFGDVVLKEKNNVIEKKIYDHVDYYKVSSFDSTTGGWSSVPATMSDDGWSFQINKNKITQEGHSVEWKFSFDTEKIQNQSQENVVAKIIAIDAKNNISFSSTHPENITDYQMDVVPYITDLITNLSSKDEDNPSIYSRSSQGRYQVRGNKNSNAAGSDSPEGESVIVKGFNLGTAPLTVTNNADDRTVLTITTDSENPHAIQIGNMKSGTLKIIANGMEVLNNLNKNDAVGSSSSNGVNNTNCYNMRANNENNNNLTDDLEIDVWEFKNGATRVSSELGNPTVKFNPNNGSIGMSYTNGVFFEMPGGVKTTHQFSHFRAMDGTNGFSDSTFAFDKNGYSYGAAQSDYDSGSTGLAGNFRFVLGRYISSNFSTDNANYGHPNSTRLEANSINLKQYPTANRDEWQNYKARIVSPQIVADAKTGNSSQVMLHIAYADTATKQIRYRRSYVNSNIAYMDNFDMNSTGENYYDYHILPFNPTTESYNSVPKVYRITKLPNNYAGSLVVGQEVDQIPSNGESYVDASFSSFLAGSSLRDINDYDSNYQMDGADFDMMDFVSGDDPITSSRIIPKQNIVDIYNNRIDQTVTGNRNSTGNKPTYPYSSFNNGMAESSFYMSPDSLQSQSGQTIHVIASSGLNGDVMDVYKKTPGQATVKDDQNQTHIAYKKNNSSSYQYNAGKSVALGLSENGSPIIAWHDNDQNKLNISFNTEEKLREAEENVQNVSKRNNGNGGTLVGIPGVTKDTPYKTTFMIYFINSSGSLYQRYVYLKNIGSPDEYGFYRSAQYDTYIGANDANKYKIVPKEYYVTPTNAYRYKVMHLISKRKVSYSNIKKVTTTKVIDENGETSSTKSTNLPGIDDVYDTIDEYVFNSDNVLTNRGAVLKKVELESDGNKKIVYIPARTHVTQYTDSGATTEYLPEIEESRTVGEDGKTTIISSHIQRSRTITVLENSCEFVTPDDTDKYSACDANFIYVSYPMYELYDYKTDGQPQFMGCAAENTQLSFDRTEVWEGNTIQLSGKGGADVKMQVLDDVVHLAYYDEDTGAVKYTRMNFTGTGFSNIKTYIVDGYNDIGEHLTLDVAKDSSGNHIPYIGYYGNKRPKMAYLKNPDAQEKNGSIKDFFTGTWDVCYVPTEKGIEPDRINVAVRKDNNGEIQSGLNQKDLNISATVSSSSSWANNARVYSNSTTNPVMGYINAYGNLELGQRR